MAAPIFLETQNGNFRHIHLRNNFNQTHQTGMRITDDGFFQITNRINGGTEARLDSGGNWTKASDRRMKRDIESVSGLLDKVVALKPVEYYYTSQDVSEQPAKQMGLIAQDVEEVLPQLVVDSVEGKYLDYLGLVPVLIGAVKELAAQVAELRDQRS
ncbi:tail fiber domain-containing protein [Actinoplanes utahensis]|uniref:Peptidase S74 domain-containing protein n=1 Tax=Actinoplanes utahensis TaxID=1869 RepID=A0A0A6UK01_ACTUT|nr:tail fiber domain-containing protein [Actinoplanes utahensis]KHD74644.1 hypothetical protein MB27_27500 [Actinoplanes utahensis]GIF31516.1 hypothetical protein Aut01nite_45020 [Actinoplanes utahensis]